MRDLIQGYRVPFSWLFVQFSLTSASRSEACFGINGVNFKS